MGGFFQSKMGHVFSGHTIILAHAKFFPTKEQSALCAPLLPRGFDGESCDLEVSALQGQDTFIAVASQKFQYQLIQAFKLHTSQLLNSHRPAVRVVFTT